MRNEEKVLKFALENEHDGVKYIMDWNGYHVYEPILDWIEQSSEPPCIGYPIVILEKGNTIRFSTVDECMSFLDFRIKIEGDDDE